MGKKRKLAEGQVEELNFDTSARQEYLTGFHKRKQARIQSAREAAIKRDKEEKVKERKLLREQRKEDLEQHVAAVNEELRKQNAIVDGGESTDAGEDDEWEGINEGSAAGQEVEELPDDEEYVDEDKFTTVTVEAMGDEGSDEEESNGEEQTKESMAASKGKEVKKKRPGAKAKDGENKPKKKKFRYESKAERQVTRQKQKSKGRAAKARRKG